MSGQDSTKKLVFKMNRLHAETHLRALELYVEQVQDPRLCVVAEIAASKMRRSLAKPSQKPKKRIAK